MAGNILCVEQPHRLYKQTKTCQHYIQCFALQQSTPLQAPQDQTALQAQTGPTPRKIEALDQFQNLPGEKCGSCLCWMRKRRNWVGNKPLDRVLIVGARSKLWMLRSSGDFASCPCASRLRESIFVLHVLDVQNCFFELVIIMLFYIILHITQLARFWTWRKAYFHH